MLSINQKLRDIIAERGLTIYQMHKATGINHTRLSNFINKGATLHYDNMIKLMVALGYRVTMVKNGSPSASRMNAASNRKDEIIDISKL